MKRLILLFISISSLSAAWNPMIERESRLEQFITQVASRYNVAIPPEYNRLPMHRESIDSFIRFSLDSLPLTEGERADGELLYSWYGAEGKALFSRHTEKARININLDVAGEVRLDIEDSVGFGAKGIINPGINGHLGKLSFASEFKIWTEYATDTIWQESKYQPYKGNPYNLFNREDSGNVRASDMFRGGVSWNLGQSQWDFGVDHLKLGPVQQNPLMMNFDNSPIAFARVNLTFPWFEYSQGALIPQTLKDYNRHMMYHRFEIPFAKKRITLGFNESVIYGSTPDSVTEAQIHEDPLEKAFYNVERTFQPTYLIPFLPYAFMEHFNGDLDNKQISLDLSVKLPEKFLWYGEFFIDDISNPATLFSDDWGNKWAFSVGGQWFPTIKGKNMIVSTEYTRIEPWVYTHFRGSSHTYQHYGNAIGSDLGPNSDNLWLDTKFQLNQKNRIGLTFENHRWNHEQRGGSIHHVYISEQTSKESGLDDNGNPNLIPDSDKKEFLAGNVQSDQVIGVSWNFLPFHLYDMNTNVQWSSYYGVGLALNGTFRF